MCQDEYKLIGLYAAEKAWTKTMDPSKAKDIEDDIKQSNEREDAENAKVKTGKAL